LDEGNPLIGVANAPVKLILIEDLNCAHCRRFTKDIFPEIERLYIETELASCVFVPLAFLKGSKPLANAAFAVYHIAPDRFVPYLHALLNGFTEEKDLIPIAKKTGGIDLAELQRAIETKRFYSKIKKNYIWAKELMGPAFETPALFVNGVQTPTASISAISEQIEKK
jgi:protein-disulfide isomerase